MAEPIYRRVVIKLSGEYLAGAQSFGIDQLTVDRIAGDLIAARQLGAEIAVVVGGGTSSAVSKYLPAASPVPPAIPWACSPP
jgi:uridylate kinase